MGRVFSSTSGGAPIDSVAPFNKTEDLPEFSDGTTWLKTGVVETDVDSYPDANITIDVSTGEYTGKSLSITAASTATGIYISADGAVAYIMLTDAIQQHSLSTPFDISTGIDLNNDLTLSSYYYDLFISPDGVYLYFIGGANSFGLQYEMSTPWDISTAVYTSKNFNFSSQDSSPADIVLSPDGEYLYIAGRTNGKVYQYELSTPWDISTSVYSSKSFDVNTELTFIAGLSIDNTGSNMFALDNSQGNIIQYEMSTPWDISTCVYNAHSLDISAEIGTGAGGMVFTDDSSITYVVRNTNVTYQYDQLQHVGYSTESTDTDTGLPIYTRIK